MKYLVFTVTNDLVYDQRMLRICDSLSRHYHVTLIGRCYKNSPSLLARNFIQKRLHCFFKKGFLFYSEYSIRLFFFLLFHKLDLVCAIDLDTILPCLLISRLRNKKRVYDAHELFCEMKEVVSRPRVRAVWKFVERLAIPNFPNGYTVNKPIRDIFSTEYRVQYQVIRNVPLLKKQEPAYEPGNFLLYQGAVNHGRCFESLIPACAYLPYPLWIYGDGNYYDEAVALVRKHGLEQKVFFKGKLLPEALREVTPKALLGITLFESNGLNNYLSLANRFFDYIHACLPQICMDYPAYREINDQYQVAKLVTDLTPAALAETIQQTISNREAYREMKQNCLQARRDLSWQQEEKNLFSFYEKLFLT